MSYIKEISIGEADFIRGLQKGYNKSINKREKYLKKLKERYLGGIKYDTELKRVMSFGQICEHDDDFLCEHRIEYIRNNIDIITK